ncbi:MAG: decarboxylating 6-phosphogluconate dehydrogenase [Deltaproteobacteria bacterium]|nr:decarboxylating 6-phosphogluconate dehydrogenase [Deltaproteobacteria bacterium]
MHIGLVGLGKMGMNMARRLTQGGHTVTAFNKTPEKTKEAEKDGIKGAYSIRELVSVLPSPRIVWLMIPAGSPVELVIEELKGLLAEGDIIVDGGNSYFRDDLRHEEELTPLKINYIDAGVSGGIWGLKNGYCVMAGGDKKICGFLEPVFKTLAPPEGYLYCGATGAGHYMKMVHNGIEYGMMEAYAEGFELLAKSQYGAGLDLKNVAHLWNRGSVVRSWLLELLEDALRKDSRLESINDYVGDSGEGRWMVKEAVESGVPLPAISEALFRRFRSQQDVSFGEKVLAALRKEFGGHGG